MFGVPTGELIVLAVAIIGGGIFTGLLAGVFGVGGGAVIVPVLYEIFRVLNVPEEVRMQLCVGTSLAIILPTSLRSFFAHRAKGNLPLNILKVWAAPVVAGMLVGAAIAGFAPSWAFKLAFIVMAGLIALKMFFVNERWRLGAELPGLPLMLFYGFVIGLYSAFMGVGGGAVSTAVLVSYNVPIHAAVGLSAGTGFMLAAAGTLGFIVSGWPYQALMPPLSIGFVSLIGFVLMAPITTFVAPFGARLAHRLPKRQLEIGFGLFLLAVAIRFSFSLFW